MISLIKFKDRKGEIQKGILITSVFVDYKYPFESYKLIVYHNNSLIQLFNTIKYTNELLGEYESYTTFDSYIEHLNCPDLDAYMERTPESTAIIYYR